LDAATAIARAMQDAGLTPPERLEQTGQILRWKGRKGSTSESSWYVWYPDTANGHGYLSGPCVFGDWAMGDGPLGKWSASGAEFTEADRRLIQEAQKAQEKARQAVYEAAALRARSIWEGLPPAPPTHQYLRVKGIQPGVARLDGDAVVIPIYQPDGQVWTLQHIHTSGKKIFMHEGKARGGFLEIKGHASTLLVCEGYATGMSLHRATGHTVYCAFTAGQLLAVARVARSRYPAATLVYCADNDYEEGKPNPGVEAAQNAAQHEKGVVAVCPRVDGAKADFNDLHVVKGDGFLRALIQDAVDGRALPEDVKSVEDASADPDYMDWIPYPVDALPQTMRDIVVKGAASVNVDPAAVAIAALTTAGAAVGNSFRFEPQELWEVPSIFWCLLVSKSGTKKNAAIKAATFPIDILETESLRAWSLEQAAYERAKLEYDDYKLQAGPKKAGPPPDPPPHRKRYRIKDITTEQFGLVHSRNERGLMLYREELDAWISSFNQYKGGKGADEATWIEIFDGDSVQIDRMSRDTKEIYIRRAHACVLGCIQPRIFRRAITDDRMASGFISRFLLTMPPQPSGPRWRKAEVDWDARDKWAEVIEGLYSVPYDEIRGPWLIKPTPEAERVMEDWVNESGRLMDAFPDHLRSMCAKVEAIAAKIALVFHLVETIEKGGEPGHLPEDIMHRAVRVAKWHRYEIARLYQQIDVRDEGGATKEDKALESLKGEFTREDITKAYGIKHQSSVSRKVKGLIEQGKIEQTARGTYRRKDDRTAALAILAQGI
jgi:putative DNA primase/helicase